MSTQIHDKEIDFSGDTLESLYRKNAQLQQPIHLKSSAPSQR
ncbi:hypothetical protein [Methylotuvimicrobium sp. KM2]